MAKGKSSGLDDLTVNFYVVFWKDIRQLLFEAIGECILRQNLSPNEAWSHYIDPKGW